MAESAPQDGSSIEANLLQKVNSKTTPAGGSSVAASIGMLGKTMVGVGMIALSDAFNKMELSLGLVCLFGAGCLSAFTLHLLTLVSVRTGKEVSFYQVAKKTMPGLSFLVDLAIFLKCIGIGTMYLIVASKSLIAAIGIPEGYTYSQWRFITTIATTVVIAMPLSLPKRARTIKNANYVSLALMLYVALVIVGAFVAYREYQPEDPALPRTYKKWGFNLQLSTVMTLLPTFVFSFTCHQNMFPIANELKDRTMNKLNLVIVVSVLCGLCFYLLCGVSGFLLFGSNSTGNLVDLLSKVNNGAWNTVWVKGANLALWFAMALSFPCQCMPGRASLWNLIYGEKEFPRAQHRLRLKIYAFLISVLCCGMAAMVDDLGMAFGVVGSIGSNSLSLILPSAMFIAAFSKENQARAIEDIEALDEQLVETSGQVPESDKSKQGTVEENNVQEYRRFREVVYPAKWKIVGAYFVLAFGCVLMPMGCYLAVNKKGH